MATLDDIREMEKELDRLTAHYKKTGDKTLLREIDRLRDKIGAAEVAIVAEKAAEQKAAANARMITPPIEPINTEEAKRQVLEEIEEVAEDPELDDQPRTRRQLRSLRQEVLANAITPEQGAMELEGHAKELGRTTPAAKVGFGPQPQSIYGKSLPRSRKPAFAGGKSAQEGRWVPSSEPDAGLTWGSLLDPDGTSTPRVDTTPRFTAGTGGVASLYAGPWNAAQWNPGAPGFGWGAAPPNSPTPQPGATPQFGTTTSAGKSGAGVGSLFGPRPRGVTGEGDTEQEQERSFPALPTYYLFSDGPILHTVGDVAAWLETLYGAQSFVDANGRHLVEMPYRGVFSLDGVIADMARIRGSRTSYYAAAEHRLTYGDAAGEEYVFANRDADDRLWPLPSGTQDDTRPFGMLEAILGEDPNLAAYHIQPIVLRREVEAIARLAASEPALNYNPAVRETVRQVLDPLYGPDRGEAEMHTLADINDIGLKLIALAQEYPEAQRLVNEWMHVWAGVGPDDIASLDRPSYYTGGGF